MSIDLIRDLQEQIHALNDRLSQVEELVDVGDGSRTGSVKSTPEIGSDGALAESAPSASETIDDEVRHSDVPSFSDRSYPAGIDGSPQTFEKGE